MSTLRNAECFFFGLAHKFFGLVDENFGLLHKFFGLDVSREALFPDFNCLKPMQHAHATRNTLEKVRRTQKNTFGKVQNML